VTKLLCLLVNVKNSSGYGSAAGLIQSLVPLLSETNEVLSRQDKILSLIAVKVALLNLARQNSDHMKVGGLTYFLSNHLLIS
jgi:hypothetical protein